MVMVVLPPERLNHLLGRFRNVLSKPQFENFRSVMFGLIMSGCKEHDVKSMRDTVGETRKVKTGRRPQRYSMHQYIIIEG